MAFSDLGTSTERHLIQPCFYEKYGRVLTNRVARDRDKELTLSHHHVSSLGENEKPFDGTFPFHLPLDIMGPYPHLPPLTKRLDGTCTYICMGSIPVRYIYRRIYSTSTLLLSTLPLLGCRTNLGIRVPLADSSQGF
ncbi:hypothetical protein AAC387_Pa01g2952 [Persea americana]